MLEGMTPPTGYRSCKIANVAATLTEKDREILLKAVEDSSTWPVVSLSRALQNRGIMLSPTPITRHRAKVCVCFA